MTLKERRVAAGFTQDYVAHYCDVDQSAVSHWELERTRPARKYRRKLACLYKCQESDLLKGGE